MDKIDADRWAEKTNFAPGVPVDPGMIPRLRYQALLGRVYTLQQWKDGSTARGEVPLSQLEALVGGSVKEGWYDATGGFLGTSQESLFDEPLPPKL